LPAAFANFLIITTLQQLQEKQQFRHASRCGHEKKKKNNKLQGSLTFDVEDTLDEAVYLRGIMNDLKRLNPELDFYFYRLY